MKKSIAVGLLTAAMGAMMIAESVGAAERREGEGYSSPEEVAQAYIEAFANNDVDGMIKTFAIETYVDHFDLAKQIDMTSVWMPTLDIPIMVNDEYSRELAVIKREAAIANCLTQQYMTYSMNAAGYEFEVLQKVEDENGESFIAEHFDEPFWIQENVENIVVYAPEDFEYTPESYFSERNQNNLKNSTACIGVDDVQELVVSFTAGQYQGYQFLQTGSYDGKWYVTTLQSNLSAILGVDTNSGGLAI